MQRIVDLLKLTGLAQVQNLQPAQRLTSALKALVQEQRADQNLRACKRSAAALGLDIPVGLELESALRRRVAARRAGRPAVRKGNMHVFLAYEGESWLTVLPRSLEPFGTVTSCDFHALGFKYQNHAQWVVAREGLDRAVLAAFREANARQPIDAVVGYMSGASTNPEILREMARDGAVVFNMCWDDKLSWPGAVMGGRFMSPAGIASAVDLNLTNAPDSIVKYRVYGGLAMFWPEAAHPDVHKPYPEELEFDVSFVGARYGWRPRFVERLQKEGINVVPFGYGWPRGPLSTDEMVRLYSRSRINLGFAGIGHSRNLMCLKGRDFEVPMSGGLYLTQDNPELAGIYDIGREIVTFSNERDCASKIRALLADPARCTAIREAGRARALRDHTYEARWTQIFQMAGLLS